MAGEWDFHLRDVLAGMGPEVVPILLRELEGNSHPRVKGQVFGAFGKMGEKAAAAIPTLIAALGHDSNGEAAGDLAHFARLALEDIGLAALPALREALKDPRPNVRERVVQILRELGPQTLPELTMALEDIDAEVRKEACFALERIKTADRAAIEHLEWLAEHDPDEEAREEAKAALESLKGGVK